MVEKIPNITIPVDFTAKRKYVKREIIGAVKQYLTENKLARPDLSHQRSKLVTKLSCKNAHLRTFPRNQAELELLFETLKNSLICPRSTIKLPDGNSPNAAINKLYGKLMEGHSGAGGLKKLLTPNLLSSILCRKNPTLIKEARDLFQHVLKDIFCQLEAESDSSPEDRLIAQGIIGNVLAYCTYFDLPKGSLLSVPVLVNGAWKLIDYRAEPISLTPAWMGSPITAYGLMPEVKAPPLLLFKGTTFPTDKGFALSLLADINPFAAVGAYPFKMGKQKLQEWLEKATQASASKARVFGQSLGGALTLHTAAHFYDLIDQAIAFAPPALLSRDLRSWNKQAAEHPEKLPEVNVFYHENDIVPLAGLKWGENWNIYRVFADRKKCFIYSHMECFLSQKGSLILKVNPKNDQRKISRRIVAILHLALSIPMFALGITIYAFYLAIRKSVELAKKILCKQAKEDLAPFEA